MRSMMQKCTIWAQKQRMQHWLRHWNKYIYIYNKLFIYHWRLSLAKMMTFALMKGIPPKASCLSWISAGIVTFSYRFLLSQVSALHVDIPYWTCRWHQKPSSCNYSLIIATSQIIIRGWQNSGPGWRAIDFPMFPLWKDQENKTWNLLSS